MFVSDSPVSRSGSHAKCVIAGFILIGIAPQIILSATRFKGLPIADYNSDVGFGFGMRAGIVRYQPEDSSTYLFRIDGEYYMTTGGVLQPMMEYDIPVNKLRNNRALRLRGRLSFDRSLYVGYYGFGNDDRQMGFDASRRDDYYYTYKRSTPGFFATGQYFFADPYSDGLKTSLFGGVTAEYCRIALSPRQPSGGTSLLFEERPPGINGGFIHAEMIGIIIDSRDFYYNPKNGMYHELSFEGSLQQLGSAYTYLKTTLLSALFVTPITHFDRLITAARFMLVSLTGDPPFYKYEHIGGLTPHDLFGGRGTMRGIPQYRYKGRASIVFTPELRFRVIDFPFLFKDIWHLEIVVFGDMGNTWRSWSDFSSQLHLTQGGGIRIAWGEDFIISADCAFWNRELSGIYLYFGHQF